MTRARADQAEGLRRMFAADATHMVALVGQDAQDISAALAVALAGRGRRVLLLDEQLGEGDMHPLFAQPILQDIGAVITGDKSLQEISLSVAGMTVLPAALHGAARGVEGSRIRLLAGFHALSDLYDVVLVHASQVSSAQRRSLGFALAAPEAIMLCDGSSSGITSCYGQIKLMAKVSGTRHFRLLFRGVDEAMAQVLFRNLASVCRQHLQLMPEYAGAVPVDPLIAADAMEALAADMSQWPVHGRDDSRFEAFMRRLLNATAPRRPVQAEP